MGTNKMWNHMCECFHWHDMACNICCWANRCLTCQTYKPLKPTNPDCLSASKVEEMEPFNEIAIDFFRPFPATVCSNTVVLVIVKWIKAILMKNQTAVLTADTFYQHWICRHGLFCQLYSNNTKNFAGCVLATLAVSPCQVPGLQAYLQPSLPPPIEPH